MWSSCTELKGEMQNVQVSYERLSPQRAFSCYSGLQARAPTNEIALLIVWVQTSSSSCTSLPLGSQLSLPLLPHGNFSLVCSLLPRSFAPCVSIRPPGRRTSRSWEASPAASHSYSKDYFFPDRTASSHQPHGKGPKQFPTCESDAETTDGFKCSNGAGINYAPLSTAREPHRLAICIFQSQGKKARLG